MFYRKLSLVSRMHCTLNIECLRCLELAFKPWSSRSPGKATSAFFLILRSFRTSCFGRKGVETSRVWSERVLRVDVGFKHCETWLWVSSIFLICSFSWNDALIFLVPCWNIKWIRRTQKTLWFLGLRLFGTTTTTPHQSHQWKPATATKSLTNP